MHQAEYVFFFFFLNRDSLLQRKDFPILKYCISSENETGIFINIFIKYSYVISESIYADSLISYMNWYFHQGQAVQLLQLTYCITEHPSLLLILSKTVESPKLLRNLMILGPSHVKASTEWRGLILILHNT